MSILDPQSSAQREPPIEIGGDISGGLPGCPGNWVRDGSEVGEPIPIRRGDRRPAYAEPHLFGGGGGKRAVQLEQSWESEEGVYTV